MYTPYGTVYGNGQCTPASSPSNPNNELIKTINSMAEEIKTLNVNYTNTVRSFNNNNKRYTGNGKCLENAPVRPCFICDGNHWMQACLHRAQVRNQIILNPNNSPLGNVRETH